MLASFAFIFLIITCELHAITSTNPAAGKCEPVPRADTIGLFSISKAMYGTCVNRGKIDGFKECRGSCDSADTYNQLRGEYETTCQCCRVARYRLVPVVLSCPYDVQMTHEVATADQCSCRLCGDNTYPQKPSSTNRLTINY